MLLSSLEKVQSYDCLYISPQAKDAVVSCLGRLLSDKSRGLRILVVGLFEKREGVTPLPESLGVDQAATGFPPARDRSPGPASFASLASGRRPDEDEWLIRTTRLLEDLGPRTRALHFYAPLGLRGHTDHRLAFEAAFRAFSGKPGRNVFFFEERPEAFVPGAVRVRLGLLGARLPAGATRAAERAGFARYVLRFPLAPAMRGDFRGLVDRFRSLALAARQWREARGWNPQRSFGPRLQPIIHPSEADAVLALRDLLGALAAGRSGRSRFAARFTNLAVAYAHRLGAAAHAERYWLLLPSLEDAQVLPAAVGQD